MDIDAYKDVFGVRRFTTTEKLRAGSVVQFTYDNEQKYALVLDPEWEGKMHALSLKSFSRNSLEEFLESIKNINTREELYNTYKNSQYTDTRPYRTYTIDKMKALREIYLKPKVTPKPTPSPTLTKQETLKETKRFSMYEE